MVMFRFFSFLMFFSATFPLLAGEGIDETVESRAGYHVFRAPGGMASQLPATGAENLLQRVRGHVAVLQEHKDALELKVEGAELGAADLLVAAVMPGGLLYTAIKAQQAVQARRALERVQTEVDDFSLDLLEMRAVAGVPLVAGLESRAGSF